MLKMKSDYWQYVLLCEVQCQHFSKSEYASVTNYTTTQNKHQKN